MNLIRENARLIVRTLDALSVLVARVPYAPRVTIEFDVAPGDLVMLLGTHERGTLTMTDEKDREYVGELKIGPLLVRALRRESTFPAPVRP